VPLSPFAVRFELAEAIGQYMAGSYNAGTPSRRGDGRVRRRVTVRPSAEGPLRVTFQGRDRAGNAAAPYWWDGTIDFTDPMVRIQVSPEPPAGNPWLPGDAHVAVTVVDQSFDPGLGLGTLEVRHNDALVGTMFPVIGSGRHEIRVWAVDAARNEAPSDEATRRVFFIDKEAPTIRLTAAPSGTAHGNYVKDSLSFTVVMTDNLANEGSLASPADLKAVVGRGPGIQFLRGEVPGGAKLDGTYLSTGADDGPLEIVWSGMDRVGNPALPAASWQGIIDNTRPPIAIVTGVGEGRWTPNDVTVNLSVDLNVEKNLATTSGELTRLDAPISKTAISSGHRVTTSGRYQVTARALDKADNEGIAAPVTFNVDKVDPKIQWIQPAPDMKYVNATAKIQATATDAYPPDIVPTLTLLAPTSFVSDEQTDQPQVIDGHLHNPPAEVTIMLQAQDLAGRSVTAMRKVTVDSTPPALEVYGHGAWVNTASYTLTGTAIDEVEGSKVDRVEVRKGATLLTSGSFDTTTFTWSQPVTLTADCAASVFNGANTFVVTAYDKVGNATTKSVEINYDPCPPKVELIAHTILDERDFALKSPGTSTCFTSGTGNRTISLTYDLHAPSGTTPARPTIYKYGINMGKATEGCAEGGEDQPLIAANLLEWRLKVTDKGQGVIGVWTEVYSPQSPNSPDETIRWAANALESSSGAYTHVVRIAPGHINPVDALNYSGNWSIRIVAYDKTGNYSEPPQRIRWSHQPIGGPIFVTPIAITSSTPLPSALTNPQSYGLAATQAPLSALIVDTHPRIAVQAYELKNATKYGTSVQMQWPYRSAVAKATYSRTIRDARPPIAATSGEFALCGQGQGLRLPSGPCVTIPIERDVASSSEATEYIRDARAFNAASGAAAELTCSDPHVCIHQTAGMKVWQVPGSGRIYVYLVTDATKFTEELWDSPWSWLSPKPTDHQVTRINPSATYNLFGTMPYQYAIDEWDAFSSQWFRTVYQYLRYAKRLQIGVNIDDQEGTELFSQVGTAFSPLPNARQQQPLIFQYDTQENPAP
jgi:hypothetical protein